MDRTLRLGLGTAGLAGDRCATVVEAALDAGYRHVDTAQTYENEAAVGRGIRRADVTREDVFLATKVRPDDLAPEDVRDSVEGSLKRLQVDSVDLLYVHWPTGAYDAATTLPAFDDLQSDGLARRIGVSNFTPALLEEACEVLDAAVFANQVELHPWHQQRELRQFARERGVPLVAYSPLAQGAVVDDPVVRDVAEKHDATPAQVALAWVLSLDAVAPVPKSGSPEHAVENYGALDVFLDEADRERLADRDRGERLVDPEEAPWNR